MNYFKLSLTLTIAFLIFSCGGSHKKSCCTKNTVTIEDVEHVGREHFKITAGHNVYLYDKKGGGLSSIIDADGADWIQFRPDTAPFPAGAASVYRGLPNFVYKSDDNGAGHPGFDKCISKVIEPNQIQSASESGLWQWTWTFSDSIAWVTVEKMDTSYAYWFLYEGPVAGKFKPYECYWGTDKGVRNEAPDHMKGENILDKWNWAFFGNQHENKVFYVAQVNNDTINDCFSYLASTREGLSSEDGMVVFGFGRAHAPQPLLKEKNTFVIGFWDKNIMAEEPYNEFSAYINNLVEKFKNTDN